MPHTPVTVETLRSQAALGGDSLKEFILGDVTLSRADKVARANEALRLLRLEMKDDPVEARKAVIAATRVILQDSLDDIRAEIKASHPDAKAALERELGEVDRTKQGVLDDERAMATHPEYVMAEAREVFNETKTGDWKKILTYGAAFAGAGIAAHWLWDRTFGALGRWFRGKEGKPGFFGTLAKWLTVAGVAVGGMIGLRAFTRSPVGKAVKDVTAGAADEAKTTVDEVSATMEHNAEFFEKLQQSKGWMEAMKVAVADGFPIIWENGSLAIWLGAGKPLKLMGGTLAQAKQWAESGEMPDDFWLLFGRALTASTVSGTVYFVGSKAMNAIVYGRLDLPNSKSGIALTALKIASGPLGIASDIVSTAGTAIRPNGRQALRIRYMTHALGGTRRFIGGLFSRGNRTIEWLRYGTKVPEANLEAAIEHWSRMQSDANVIDQFSKTEGDLFTPDQAADAKALAGEEAARIQAAMRALPADAAHSPALQSLRASAHSTPERFASSMHEYLAEREQARVDEQARSTAASTDQNAAAAPTPSSTSEVAPAAAASASADASVGNGSPSPAADAASTQAPADTVAPVQPSSGPIRVRPAPVQPGPGPQRVQPAPVQPVPATESDAGPVIETPPAPSAVPADPGAAPDEELKLAPAEPRVAPTLPPTAVDPDADLALAPADDDLKLAPVDEELKLAPSDPAPAPADAAPVAPSPAPRRVGSDGASLPVPGRGPDEGDATGPAARNGLPPKALLPGAAMRAEPSSDASPKPTFDIPEEELDRRLGVPDEQSAARARRRQLMARTPSVDLGTVAEAADSGGVDSRTGDERSDSRTDVDSSAKTNPRGGRKGG